MEAQLLHSCGCSVELYAIIKKFLCHLYTWGRAASLVDCSGCQCNSAFLQDPCLVPLDQLFRELLETNLKQVSGVLQTLSSLSIYSSVTLRDHSSGSPRAFLMQIIPKVCFGWTNLLSRQALKSELNQFINSSPVE